MRAAWLCLTLVACGGHGDARSSSGALARSIERGLAAQLGVEVTDVRCGGARCTATIAGGGALTIAVHGKDWETDGLVVAAAPLEEYLRQVDGDLGVTAPVTCGPRVQEVKPGDRVECRLGDAGRAFATVQAGGDFTIELAIGADAIAAREASRDEVALDRASAALDHDDRGGDHEDEGGDVTDAVDAGAPTSGPR